jgi:hypothetical protein
MTKKFSPAKSLTLGLAGALTLVGLYAANSQAATTTTYAFIDSTANTRHDLTVEITYPGSQSSNDSKCLQVGGGAAPAPISVPSGSSLWAREYVGSDKSCYGYRNGGVLKIVTTAQLYAANGVIDLAQRP